MVSRYTGDPAVFIDENRAYLIFRGGQPLMDAGLYNAVILSLFTRYETDGKPWPGNLLFDTDSQRVGSDFERAASQSLTIATLNDVRDAAEKALAWMLKPGSRLASKITVTTSNPTGSVLRVVILIEPPGRDIQQLTLERHGQNWIAQINDPVHERV